MIFIVKNNKFQIQNGRLYINDSRIEVKQKTIDTLICFLTSNNQILSKDSMMEAVWKKSIVSESSLFKQVQMVRKIFTNAGFDEDIIESVYGIGYRLSAKIQVVSDDHKSHSHKTGKGFRTKSPLVYGSGLMLAIVLSIAVILLFQVTEQELIEDTLTDEQRASISSNLSLDWKLGLESVNTLLSQKDVRYSDNDMGFLYQSKGLAELQLHKTKEAAESLEKSLSLFPSESLSDIAESYILLSRTYSSLNERSKSNDSINKALDLYRKSSDRKLIDVLMTKSLMLRKQGKVDESIQLNHESLQLANELGDSMGELIAISNLATTHYQLGELETAESLIHDGLQLSLKFGTSQHVANSYTLISTIQQSKGDLIESLRNSELALKYQITNNNVRYLAPKLYNYIHLLIQFHQFGAVESLLPVSFQFLNNVKAKNKTRSQFTFLKGFYLLMQNDWEASIEEFTKSLNLLDQTDLKNFKAELFTNMSYSYYFNDNHLKSIEYAKLAKEAKDTMESNALTALNYLALDQLDLFQSQIQLADNHINKNPIYNPEMLSRAFNNLPKGYNPPQIKETLSHRLEAKNNVSLDLKLLEELITFILNI